MYRYGPMVAYDDPLEVQAMVLTEATLHPDKIVADESGDVYYNGGISTGVRDGMYGISVRHVNNTPFTACDLGKLEQFRHEGRVDERVARQVEIFVDSGFVDSMIGGLRTLAAEKFDGPAFRYNRVDSIEDPSSPNYRPVSLPNRQKSIGELHSKLFFLNRHC